MARIWPIDPAVPSAAIQAMHQSIVVTARELFADAREVEDHRLMALAEDLLAWSITLERMAVTSPTYHAALGRSFADHPRFGEEVDDRLVPHRAQADLLAFVGIGDLVLNQLGRLWMRQLRQPIPAAQEGFGELLQAVDRATGTTIVAPVRRLQVSLRSARNRLLAHVRPDHGEIRAWATDDTPQVTLVGLADPADVQRAVATLNAKLRNPPPETYVSSPRDYIDAVIARASTLTSPELSALDRAMRVIGYVSLPVSGIVEDVLRLARPLEPVPGGFTVDPRELVDE